VLLATSAFSQSFPVVPGLSPATADDISPDDLDGDGIPQKVEFELARHFFPTIWYDSGEDTSAPGGNKNHRELNQPGRVVFRVRPHPKLADHIAISYAVLYRVDGGFSISFPLPDFACHRGDAEPFAISLKPDPSCPLGYRIESIETWAHEGTSGEIRSIRFLDACNWGFSNAPVTKTDVVLASRNKHGNYLTESDCATGLAGFDKCSYDWTNGDVNSWIGMNIGEAATGFRLDLTPLGFSDPSDQPFCGNPLSPADLDSLSCALQQSCPGPVQKNFTDKFVAPVSFRSPPPNHPIDFGYYFVDGKYGDYRGEVNCYTNLYYALPVNNYFSDANWPPLFQESMANAAAEERRIHLNLNWDALGGNIGQVLDIAAPFWSSVARIEMQDEPGWSRAETEQNVSSLRSMLAARGLPARPIGNVYTRSQILNDDAPDANGLDWVGIEAYLNPPGSPDPGTNTEELRLYLNVAKARVPASKDIVLVMMAYDRNGAWTNIETLVEIQYNTYTLAAANDPRVVAITMFAYGRPGGSRDHPELKAAHREIGKALFGPLPDSCNVAPPPPITDPPTLTGPEGCITNLRPTFSWSAVQGATRYRIVVIQTARDAIVFNAVTTGLSFTAPSTLLGGQEYRWKVKGMNSGGSGPYSDSMYFRTNCGFEGPYLLSAGPGCVDTLRPTFTWGAVPGARDYRIVVAPAGTDNFFISEFPAATSFTPSFDLQAGQEYRWKVKGRNDVVDGTFSRHRFFTPGCSRNIGTASPLSPWFGTIPTGNPVFNWEISSNADRYDLIITNPSGTVIFRQRYLAEQICSPLDCSVTPALSLADGTYVWEVVGGTATAAGPGSPEISFTVAAGAPGPPTPAGLNVNVSSGSVSTNFELVGTPGTTTVVPLDAGALPPLPVGFRPFNNMAFDVSTTAQFFDQVSVTFQLLPVSPDQFVRLRVFHRELDQWVNRTRSIDLSANTLTARVNSLSPFVIAEAIVNRPPVARCRNLELAQGGSAMVSVTAAQVDAGSSDPDGDALTFVLQPAGPFGLGAHAVVLSVTDSHGASSSCAATITIVDRAPPTTTVAATPPANVAGWQKSDVTISFTAADNVGGSGVQSITYRAEGAQNIASTTVIGASASAQISANGVTTLFFGSRDQAGNEEAIKTLIVRLDKLAPAINCGTADGQWHASDVTITCSATDPHSGLADPANGSFSLATAVPSGTETANAATTARTVCDVAGNCSNGGPIGGNKIDKKPPSIVIKSPAATTYTIGQAVPAMYACADGGSGLQSCSGPVASGMNISTAAIGPITFNVKAQDQVGNHSTASVLYAVTYGVCAQYDQEKEYKAGSTIPVRLQLCDAAGRNLSAPQIAVTATAVTNVAGTISQPPEDAGGANPGNLFRYVGGNSEQAGYLFNLSTKNLVANEYRLAFSVDGDPIVHTVKFVLR